MLAFVVFEVLDTVALAGEEVFVAEDSFTAVVFAAILVVCTN